MVMRYPPSIEEQIVEDILGDLLDRQGLADAFYQIDPGIQSEIKEAWIKIVVRIFSQRGVDFY